MKSDNTQRMEAKLAALQARLRLLKRNGPQEQLLSAIASDITNGEITVIDPDGMFDAINKSFPFAGSAIDWKNVPGSIESDAPAEEYFVSARDFMEAVFILLGLRDGDSIVILGDSAMEVGLSLTVASLRKHLDDVLLMPQHTYVVSADNLWCLCFGMSGWMGFGYAPAVNPPVSLG